MTQPRDASSSAPERTSAQSSESSESSESAGSLEPVIVTAEVGPAHDGLAEAVIGIRYPNGAIRHVALDPEAITPVLAAQHVDTLADLIGLPWSILLPDSSPSV